MADGRSNTSSSFETWQAALPRRVATLARIGPLHKFEATKASRTLQLSSHDLRTLALMVFDAIIERMGLAAGASYEEVVEALRPLIQAAEPDADAPRITAIVTKVLDFLLNEDDRRRAFREEILVVDGTTQITREITFHYLQQVLGASDEILYRATVEGINLYTGTLGLDVEDAHAANAAVLKYQIGRGRFREAVATARQAVAITTAYEQKVRRALEMARRDVTQVDWAEEILKTLTDARDHLRNRIDADNEILRAVEEHGEDANAQERGHVGELVERIQECQARNSRLHVLVIDANESWLNEHSRQSFRPRALGVLPDLEASLLRCALATKEDALDEETSWRLAAAFLLPSPPAIADGQRLLELLLAPIRERENYLLLAEPDAEEVNQFPDRFSEQDYRQVDELLNDTPPTGSYVSELLRQAELTGHSETAQILLYLLALRDYGETRETTEYAIEATDRCFFLDRFWGDDLLIRPWQQLPEEQS